MNGELKPEYRRRIIEILTANPKVERVVLFGSRARGEARPASDVDLALYGKDLTLADLARFQAELEETDIPQRIDLILADAIDNLSLRNQIETEGIEWFRRRREEAVP
ncbi:conserved hypothetical protein [Methylomarinovum tepidoasis]|uniref:Polymerase beta nucleotidyltransferase domain-containing protein n=1 Tax=Methylomarinovum tepidoasis TaxID=2840183 RepID=A0AAU9CAW7_9GAMM|nr:nucleotidyltransferase domain-containing protein [Methylomarinovum sp. IN45]BCX89655.1 conserved hypothetical protein [Methylomarinovum sp. IN45]